jgi:hypothetical protein
MLCVTVAGTELVGCVSFAGTTVVHVVVGGPTLINGAKEPENSNV